MKTLSVPKIQLSGDFEPELLRATLERNGAHAKVDVAPWDAFPYKPEVTVDVAATDDFLFVNFNVVGRGLKAEFSSTNEPVWQDSCVEFFAADPQGEGYRNFEINCIGTLLSAYQEGKGVNVREIAEDEASKVIRHTSLPGTPFAEKDGIHSWCVTVGIPWSLLGCNEIPDSLKVNFYKCADGSKWPHYLCWSPIDTPEPDFHRPEFFGLLSFEK